MTVREYEKYKFIISKKIGINVVFINKKNSYSFQSFYSNLSEKRGGKRGPDGGRGCQAQPDEGILSQPDWEYSIPAGGKPPQAGPVTGLGYTLGRTCGSNGVPPDRTWTWDQWLEVL